MFSLYDSVALGEDGPTHQPVEHIPALRAIPGLTVIRPADANEAAEAWKVGVEHKEGPVALLMTRQAVPVIDRTRFSPAEGLKHGAYVLADSPSGRPEVLFLASGLKSSPRWRPIKSVRKREFPPAWSACPPGSFSRNNRKNTRTGSFHRNRS